jgi:hypothetical protein
MRSARDLIDTRHLAVGFAERGGHVSHRRPCGAGARKGEAGLSLGNRLSRGGLNPGRPLWISACAGMTSAQFFNCNWGQIQFSAVMQAQRTYSNFAPDSAPIFTRAAAYMARTFSTGVSLRIPKAVSRMRFPPLFQTLSRRCLTAPSTSVGVPIAIIEGDKSVRSNQ